MQTFNVRGMSCGHCIKAVTQAVQAMDATADVQVDLNANLVRVESTLPVDAVARAIGEEGYEVSLAEGF